MNLDNEPSRLDELLRRREELRKRGQSVSAEELAKDCPDLIPELERQIEAIEGLGRFLEKHSSRSRLSDETQAAEVGQLLRRRLMAVVVICLTYAGTDWLLLWWSTPRASTTLFADYFVPCATLTALLAFLVRQRRLSLRVLRGIELVLFGFITLAILYGEFDWYASGWVEDVGASRYAEKFWAVAGDSFSIPWLLLVVLYGTCIPNEGRRCALVIGGMALVAMSGILVLCWQGKLPAPMQPHLMGRTALYLTIGGAFAVYGSHSLSRLRREAAEARKLGQYVLKRFLGGGGMGQVFLAEHQLLQRLCAVKIIHPDQFDDDQSFQRFEREVKATASLTHGSIVEIYDYGRTDDGLFFYVMEYLPGLTLQEMVERFGPLPPARVVYLLRQLCWGLREAHARGLIHRDIKPSNILICRRGGLDDVAKLFDFGLVKEAKTRDDARAAPAATAAPAAEATPLPGRDLTQAGHVVGTPRYMSPEQIAGDSALDGRSDLYSLGLVAYFALTAKHVFHGRSFRDFAAAHRDAYVPPLIDVCPQVDMDLHETVMRCLQKDRGQRFPDAETLEAALARLRLRQSVDARPRRRLVAGPGADNLEFTTGAAPHLDK